MQQFKLSKTEEQLQDLKQRDWLVTEALPVLRSTIVEDIQVRRSRPLAVLEPFDLPELAPNCTKRPSSTVPTQSLELLNSDFVTAQARFFAVRLTNLSQDIETQVSHGWQLAFSQEISEDKKREAVEFITQMQALLTKEYEAKKLNDDPIVDAVATFCQALISSNRFLYIE